MKIQEIKDDGSGYGSHIPALNLISKAYKINTVVEFGMGNFSTKYFMCKQAEIISVEMQSEEWFAKMCEELIPYAKWSWTPILALGATEWRKLTYPEKIDLCFVDGHEKARVDNVNFMFGRANIIVAHDFECPVYGWQHIDKPEDYRLIIFQNNNKTQTAVFIHENLLSHD